MFENTAFGPDVVGQDRTDHEPGRRRGHAPDAQGAVREAGERSRELVHPDRIAVDQEIPAASLAALGEMDQRASTVLHVNGRHQRPGLPELQYMAAFHDGVDDAFAKPRAVAVDPPGERR